MLIYRVFALIFGYCTFTIEGTHARAVNLLISESVNAFNMHIENGALVFDILLPSRKKVIGILISGGFYEAPGNITLHGLPRFIFRYGKRWGVIVGALIFTAVVYSSSLFIWQIEVVGNEEFNDSEITDNLKELGFGVGSFIPPINAKLLANEYLLEYGELSWISINIIGTKAEINIREFLPGNNHNENNPDDLPSVITASRDGFIERIVLSNGRIIAAAGSAVRKGDTIISGMLDKEDGSFRLVRSSAEVYAKTEHTFTVRIPYTRIVTNELPTGQTDKYLVFFSEALPLSEAKNTAGHKKLTTDYIVLFGSVTLPIGITTARYYDLFECETVSDRNQAEELAVKELARLMESELKDADILSKTTDVSEDGEGITLTAVVRCIENIASERLIVAGDY